MKDKKKKSSNLGIKPPSGRVIPNEPWQVCCNMTEKGNDTPEGAFLPRCPSDRPTTHVKINECDY